MLFLSSPLHICSFTLSLSSLISCTHHIRSSLALSCVTFVLNVFTSLSTHVFYHLLLMFTMYFYCVFTMPVLLLYVSLVEKKMEEKHNSSLLLDPLSRLQFI